LINLNAVMRDAIAFMRRARVAHGAAATRRNRRHARIARAVVSSFG